MLKFIFRNFFSISKFFEILQGPRKGNILKWLIRWFFIDLNMLLICGIVFLFNLNKPSKTDARCIGRFDDGINNKFTLNIKEAISSGGSKPENIYKDGGQSTIWIDTGFETNGENLIVYVNGDYFPWGKKLTEKALTYTSTLQQTEDGITTSMDLKEDYVACELNTDIFYNTIDNEDIRVMYSNFLNKYTQLNPNNRISGKSYVLYNSSTDITGFSKTQSDCIYHNNCSKGGDDDQSPIGCVLKNGAGIYMKIGENSNYAYHIINHLIPELEKKCNSLGYCEYVYKTYSGKVSVTQVPFGLPLMVYNKDRVNSLIRDTQESRNDVIPITLYDKETDYEFTTYETVSSSPCDSIGKKASEYETIDGSCYKSVVKKIKPEELQAHYCPIDEKLSSYKHPDELCPPKAGQRIFIKPADTFYDDDEGEIVLTFISGVKDRSMSKKGFELSWIQYIAYKILSPLIGDQEKEDNPEKVFTTERLNDEIRITNKTGEKIYITSYNNDYILKTSRYGSKGLLIKVRDHEKSVNYLEYPMYQSTTEQNIVIIKAKKNISISLVKLEFVKSTITGLVKFDNLNEGLFVKTRNMILNSSVFLIAKILFIVWYVFSFGAGVVNKSNVISLPTFTQDWKNILIFLWATDAGNYQIIDDILWPALFSGAESFAMIFLEAGNNVYGSSIHTANAFDFFDSAIQSMTSKEVWLKVVALGTHMQFFFLFLFWLPLFCTGIIKFIRCICGTVFGLIITVAFLGTLIMMMPVYALVSLLKQYSGEFKNVFKQLIQEAIHYSLELGFFCFFIGFVYQAYFDAISFSICWKKIYYKLFGLIKITKTTWEFVNDAGEGITGGKAQIALISKSLFYAFKFFLSAMLSGYFVSASRYAALLFHTSPGTGFGLGNGVPFAKFFDKTIDTTTSAISYVLSGSFIPSKKGSNDIRNQGGNGGQRFGINTNQQFNEMLKNGGNNVNNPAFVDRNGNPININNNNNNKNNTRDSGNNAENGGILGKVLNFIGRGGTDNNVKGNAGNSGNNAENGGILGKVLNFIGRGGADENVKGWENNKNRLSSTIYGVLGRGSLGKVDKNALKNKNTINRGTNIVDDRQTKSTNIKNVNNVKNVKIKSSPYLVSKTASFHISGNTKAPVRREAIQNMNFSLNVKKNNTVAEFRQALQNVESSNRKLQKIEGVVKNVNLNLNMNINKNIKSNTSIKETQIKDNRVKIDDKNVNLVNKDNNISIEEQQNNVKNKNNTNNRYVQDAWVLKDRKTEQRPKIRRNIDNNDNSITYYPVKNNNSQTLEDKKNKNTQNKDNNTPISYVDGSKNNKQQNKDNVNNDMLNKLINKDNNIKQEEKRDTIININNNLNENQNTINENNNKQKTMLIQDNDMLMSTNKDMLIQQNKDLLMNSNVEMVGGLSLNQEQENQQQLDIATENQINNMDKKVGDARMQKAEAMQELFDTISKNKQAEQELKKADESEKVQLQKELQEAMQEKQQAMKEFEEQTKEFIKTQRQQKELYKKNNMLDSWSKKKK